MVRTKPALFFRVFLAQLILILLCFVSGIVLVHYLFAPGISMFLMRNPVILFPVLLGLIGIGGLLSLWTAAVVTEPIERILEALKEEHPEEELGKIHRLPGVEETDDLLLGLQSFVAKSKAEERLVRREY